MMDNTTLETLQTLLAAIEKFPDPRRATAEWKQAFALLQKLPQDTTLGLWGGMFQHSGEYRAAFCKALGMDANLLPSPPEMGAVWAAMRLMC